MQDVCKKTKNLKRIFRLIDTWTYTSFKLLLWENAVFFMSMKEKLLPKKDLVPHSGGRHETMKAMNFNDFNVLFTEQWIAYIKPCVYLLGNKMGFLFFFCKSLTKMLLGVLDAQRRQIQNTTYKAICVSRFAPKY